MSCRLGGCLCEILTTILPCYGCLQICRCPVGPTGPTGQTGSGISGSTASAFLIPFSSGTSPFTLIPIITNEPTTNVTVATLAFGSNSSGIPAMGTSLMDLTITGYTLPYEAFTTPTSLLITDLYGEFIYTSGNVGISNTYTIIATVYTAASGITSFTSTGATASAMFTGDLLTGTIFKLTSTFSNPVSVPSMSKIVLVLSFGALNDTVVSIPGVFSGGIRGYLV